MRTKLSVASALALVLAAGTASAQTADKGNVWGHGTTATAIAGIATDRTRHGPAVGGAIGWEITPHVGLEGDGAWARFGDGMSSFAAALKARVAILGKRPIDPFVQAGVGFYRTSFAADARRAPAFYERRMTGGITHRGGGLAFTDPTVVAGGGVSIFVNRHIALRPAANATVVLRDRRHYTVTTVALQAVYYFEDSPVTPPAPRSKKAP